MQLGALARELVRASDVASIKDAYHVLQGINALTGDGVLPLPVQLHLTSAAVSVKEVRPQPPSSLRHVPCLVLFPKFVTMYWATGWSGSVMPGKDEQQVSMRRRFVQQAC